MGDSLSIRITPKLRKELQKLSRRQARPTSEIAREALRRYVAAERLRELRESLRPYAEAQGFHTDEDFFKAVS